MCSALHFCASMCEYKEYYVERDQHHVEHKWLVEQSDAMLILYVAQSEGWVKHEWCHVEHEWHTVKDAPEGGRTDHG
jgi:hypothetical protein